MESKTTQTPTHDGLHKTNEVERELEALAKKAYETLEYLRTSGEITDRTEKLIEDLNKSIVALKEDRKKYFNSFEYLQLCSNIIELTVAIQRNRRIRLSFEESPQE